jgi:hypothetical protein
MNTALLSVRYARDSPASAERLPARAFAISRAATCETEPASRITPWRTNPHRWE